MMLALPVAVVVDISVLSKLQVMCGLGLADIMLAGCCCRNVHFIKTTRNMWPGT